MAHALILGASGISGWSLLNQTRTYPSSTYFSRITGLANRPFTLEQAQLPADQSYQIVSGVNLLKSVDEIAAKLKSQVKDVATISHVFFCGMSPSFTAACAIHYHQSNIEQHISKRTTTRS